jgi:hypothetical protein
MTDEYFLVEEFHGPFDDPKTRDFCDRDEAARYFNSRSACEVHLWRVWRGNRVELLAEKSSLVCAAI